MADSDLTRLKPSGTGLLDIRKKRILTPRAFEAGFLGLSISCAFYALMHFIHVEGIAHPGIIMFLPLTAITWIALMIPLLMFVVYQDDFRNMHPLNPVHFVQIAARCFRAMKHNNFKVSEKNL
ncbi:hypothetical protein HYH03_000368 [Edaphochlamys debaryana]|uniref:Uncharacterized protein n=1 Tax=Edaphochlamys debaryana TaxID=47281 RepID=A0A835YFI1_9CHLO|nr:hypothetical protein HYH03_000368 [Edaphochlamys debaryana]|eukprot:KAG2501870.1 hypothetical protein HYH03_000368 [Edaphochlamys debaryana]